MVSAGNHSHDIALNIPRVDLQNLSADDREKAVDYGHSWLDTRQRRLLSDAETFSGITIAADDCGRLRPYRQSQRGSILLLGQRHPCTINAQGPRDTRRTIKPDILLPGGRQFISEKMGTAHTSAVLQTANFSRPPGQRVAAPGSTDDLIRTWHTSRTSNSAARRPARWAIALFDHLSQLSRTCLEPTCRRSMM